MPGLSVVIAAFNSIRHIGPCLDSLFRQDSLAPEVIVVDNGSKDGTAAFIKERYPGVILIENRENLGACKARNQGIGLARGEWILTLDCDIVLADDFIRRLIKAAESSPVDTGMLQPKIFDAGGKTIYSGGILLSFLKRFYDIGRGGVDTPEFKRPKYIFGACCAAAAYRRVMLEDIKEDTGYFDERFFFLVEDVDLSWRAQVKGWRVLFSPDLICYHSGNSSLAGRPLRQYLSWRNRKLMLAKHRLSRIRSVMILVFYEFPREVFLFAVNGHVRRKIRDLQADDDPPDQAYFGQEKGKVDGVVD